MVSTLNKIIGMGQSELFSHIVSNRAMGENVIVSNKNYIYIDNSCDMLLVSHLDTINDHMPNSCIGYDDRCGVSIMLDMLDDMNTDFLFTCDEEIGGWGMSKWLEDTGDDMMCYYTAVIGLDRKGTNEIATYGNNYKYIGLIEAIRKIDNSWKEVAGTFTDIALIEEALSTGIVNLSCGFNKEHTLDEWFDEEQYNNTVEMLNKLIRIW